MNGSVRYPLCRPGDWPETQDAFCRLISDRDNIDIILWHGFPFVGKHSQEYCGVLLRQKKKINNTIIYPVLSLYPTGMNKKKDDWFQMVQKNITGYPCPSRHAQSGTGGISDHRENITGGIIQNTLIALVIKRY